MQGKRMSDGTPIMSLSNPQPMGNGLPSDTHPPQTNGVTGEVEAELRFTPGNKRRRTTVGRPQTSKSPGEPLWPEYPIS